ncbi:MAG: preprotein translocase subunit SecE [Cyanobacteria bacterium]|uniref:preprotein translocase subunit SecE n=1 Tax=Geminocystis sp. TaxID=2664100 RepID=UPI001DBBA67D|nr:preprotein translocase subunit SecE [Cyanobacteria bacterium CG_2015-16_32_12]NCO77714.1 preprotein translocase subunit SecE [Cyanobacteria bacterium CG_2015-22_32_23]NCQ03018.1 preprotein translocase subunit SecE [Cyanobacteria bacterium CG_2015-09_32_10]NCQ40720.1 preprotein translocase subunit SecE [Cyanobacteria bacterium CG_2015-04_32_10]NCS85336.1 preprotein translocase subunit SecE [Cyanobacteria bacterium CG_2015-02_32_10]
MANKETVKEKNITPSDSQNNSLTQANFVEETKQELAKVVWPSRQQLLSESLAVILMVALVASLIYLVDKIFGWAAGKVF